MLDGFKYKLSGKSYWVASYRLRPDIHEWDIDEWFNLPREGMTELRLHCPNGKVGVLGNPSGIGDRVFQFKTARVGAGDWGRMTTHHTIGMLTSTEGHVTTWTWDYVDQKLIGPVHEQLTQSGAVESLGPVAATLNFDLLGAKIG